MVYVLVGVICFIAGFIFAVKLKDSLNAKRFIGDLRIDHSIPEEDPYLFLEIYKGIDIDTISEKDFIILKVNKRDYISHE